MNDVERAWAVLGLRPGASPADVRSQYRALTRRWHPDQYASDPSGEKDAAIRMRAITSAYRCLLEAGAIHPIDVAGEASTVSGTRLSRAEIDRLVEVVGDESPLNGALGTVPYVRQTEALWRWISHKTPGDQWKINVSAGIGLVNLAGWGLVLLLQVATGRDMLNSPLIYPIMIAMFLGSVFVVLKWRNDAL